MTGETENGRSISVIRKLLPLKSNLAIAQAAARPKTRLSGTAIAATSSVSRIAAQRVGLGDRRRRTPPTPSRSASTKTTTSGSSRNRPRKATAGDEHEPRDRRVVSQSAAPVATLESPRCVRLLSSAHSRISCGSRAGAG